MAKKYENIIVGAGCGGITAGGYLAKAGQKTLIVEKMNRSGGRVRNYEREGGWIMQDQGPSICINWDGGGIPTAARELDANIQYFPYPMAGCKVYKDGKKPTIFKMYPSASAATSYAESVIPQKISEETRKEFIRVFDEILNTHYKVLIDEWSPVPLGEWLAARTSDPVVSGFFINFAAAANMCEYDRAAKIFGAGQVFANMRMWLNGDGFLAAIYPDPVKGMIKPFEKKFLDYGGELMLSTEVTEIVMEGNKAVGVKIRPVGGGKEEYFEADRVIVNAVYKNIPKIFKIKLPEEIQKPIDLANSLAGLMTFYVVYGLNKKMTDCGSYIMVTDEKGNNLGGADPKTVYMPWSAPEGKQLYLFVKIYPIEQKDYVLSHIDEVYAECNDLCEDIWPGFKEAIEWIDHSARMPPLWHHQFMYSKLPMMPKTLQNLYFVGDGVHPQYGGGADGAVFTGLTLAQKLLGTFREYNEYNI